MSAERPLPDRPSPASPAVALERFRTALGPERVATGAAIGPRNSTIGATRVVAGLLKPRHVADIQVIVEIATATRSPLYPISTGRNWGYGDALPPVDDCFILDLSAMNRILELDPALGLVTLEPGVTQGQLRAYLDARGLRFMVPVTGAGPDCSLVGNALERGFGITPYADHFGAVTALEAVLPDGRIYRSSFAEQGAGLADRAFKWGVGPYLDGLFTQGGFGIVTQVTLALAPQAEAVTAFMFSLGDEAALGAAVDIVRNLLRTPGLSLSGINLMNAHRVLAMLEPYPDAAQDAGVVSDAFVQSGLRRHRLGAWTGIGAIYAPRRLMRRACDHVRRLLAPIDARPQFVGDRMLRRLQRLIRRLPARAAPGLRARLDRAEALLAVLEGVPTRVALALPYWRDGAPTPEGDRDPARDGCGIIWYAPVVPMTATAVEDFLALARRITVAHGFNPLITLTSLSDRAFDSTVPIVFRAPDETARARACYAALFAAGRESGLLPYRLNIDAMGPLVDDPGSVFWPLVGRLKAAVDPSGIIAPGRYAPLAPGQRPAEMGRDKENAPGRKTRGV